MEEIKKMTDHVVFNFVPKIVHPICSYVYAKIIMIFVVFKISTVNHYKKKKKKIKLQRASMVRLD